MVLDVEAPLPWQSGWPFSIVRNRLPKVFLNVLRPQFVNSIHDQSDFGFSDELAEWPGAFLLGWWPAGSWFRAGIGPDERGSSIVWFVYCTDEVACYIHDGNEARDLTHRPKLILLKNPTFSFLSSCKSLIINVIIFELFRKPGVFQRNPNYGLTLFPGRDMRQNRPGVWVGFSQRHGGVLSK